jgi:hypothetical protein
VRPPSASQQKAFDEIWETGWCIAGRRLDRARERLRQVLINSVLPRTSILRDPAWIMFYDKEVDQPASLFLRK